MDNILTLVESVLKSDLESRNNDVRLILEVWKKQGYWIPQSFEDALLSRSAANPESIRRTRQKLQEEGRYQASPQVKQARANKQEAVKEWVGDKLAGNDYQSLF